MCFLFAFWSFENPNKFKLFQRYCIFAELWNSSAMIKNNFQSPHKKLKNIFLGSVKKKGSKFKNYFTSSPASCRSWVSLTLVLYLSLTTWLPAAA
jgi:hypothetical protein